MAQITQPQMTQMAQIETVCEPPPVKDPSVAELLLTPRFRPRWSACGRWARCVWPYPSVHLKCSSVICVYLRNLRLFYLWLFYLWLSCVT
jgi:hypothetical protein